MAEGDFAKLPEVCIEAHKPDFTQLIGKKPINCVKDWSIHAPMRHKLQAAFQRSTLGNATPGIVIATALSNSARIVLEIVVCSVGL